MKRYHLDIKKHKTVITPFVFFISQSRNNENVIENVKKLTFLIKKSKLQILYKFEYILRNARIITLRRQARRDAEQVDLRVKT